MPTNETSLYLTNDNVTNQCHNNNNTNSSCGSESTVANYMLHFIVSLSLLHLVLESAIITSLTLTLLECIAVTRTISLRLGTTRTGGAALTLGSATRILLDLAAVLASGRFILECLLCVELLLTSRESEGGIAFLIQIKVKIPINI